MERSHLLDLAPADLVPWLADHGEPAYRSTQIAEWVWRRGVTSAQEMTNLPRALREAIDGAFEIEAGRELARSEADDGTAKLLIGWRAGGSTETVMIPAPEGGRDPSRRTLCVSTQVGCDVGCRFCATGLDRSLRNLTVGEVLEQALRISRLLAERGERLSHVVFMGMGEPLANYEVAVEAIRRLNASWGLGIAQRRITVSTVGLPKQIERLAGEGLQVTLALSLHAPSDALRRDLVPWARGIPLDRLLRSCERYFARTGREVTFEYCLLAGVNDGLAEADGLAALARRLRAHVNLMMYNPVPGLPFVRPSVEAASRFLARLREQGAKAHLRHSRGLGTEAACGQLRRRRDAVDPVLDP